MDSKTVITSRKRRLQDNNKGQKRPLDQLVQVRILVPQVSLAETINATIAAGLSEKHAYIRLL